MKTTIQIEIDGDLSFPSIDSLNIKGRPVTLDLVGVVVAGLEASIGAVVRGRDVAQGVTLRLTASTAVVTLGDAPTAEV